MCSARSLLAASLCILISFPAAFGAPAPEPLGRANASVRRSPERLPAFVGLSVFEGESISAEVEGKLGVRIGSVALALWGNSSATLHRMSGGTHVDMESGWSYFSSPANSSLEVHAIEALLRPAKNQPTQARVRNYTRQVSAIRGDLLLTYRDESRIIPEGRTCPINLDPESATQKPAGSARVNSSSMSRSKIAIFAAAGVACGLAAWGIHGLSESSSGPESPAKP